VHLSTFIDEIRLAIVMLFRYKTSANRPQCLHTRRFDVGYRTLRSAKVASVLALGGDVAHHPARLVFVGAATIDTIALVPRYPGADERVVVDELARAGGGPAATAAVVAARAGHDVAVVSAVGDDADGDEIIAGLAAEGIDVSGITRVRGARSSSTSITVASNPPTRAMCNRPGPALELPIDRLKDAIDGASWVHVDHHGWPLISKIWQELPAQGRALLSVDDGHPTSEIDPAMADLYVPPLAVLRHRSGRESVSEALAWALERGCAAVVATDGEAGSYGRDGETAEFRVAAAPAHVVSTLGAGDVFHGALVSALADGLELLAAVQHANIVAAKSCAALDGRTAIPRREEVSPRTRAADSAAAGAE
jgi:sulfofructose kinase